VTPEQARTRYKRKKYSVGKQRAIVALKTKADARARSFIERHAAGETHQQIADSLGVSQSCVTKAITKYYQRHPHLKKETADA
jgi:DNA invertase Pin-like site-specific DNA recombinase